VILLETVIQPITGDTIGVDLEWRETQAVFWGDGNGNVSREGLPAAHKALRTRTALAH